MPRKVTPMKFRGFYCSDELYKQMQDMAISLNESDSEYIRKAVGQRNVIHKQGAMEHGILQQVDKEMKVQESISKNKPTMVQSFMKGGK